MKTSENHVKIMGNYMAILPKKWRFSCRLRGSASHEGGREGSPARRWVDMFHAHTIVTVELSEEGKCSYMFTDLIMLFHVVSMIFTAFGWFWEFANPNFWLTSPCFWVYV